ncbi:hypothetical protein, partial [Streptomyces diastaticus]|uniref:hypothetical protein n=2 Tax=Streptomyces diastaticus TaxID=1956 RepID=UPI003646B7AB
MVSGSGQSGVADQGGHGDTGESRLADVGQSARGTVAVAALLLEVLTKALDVAVGDEAGGESEEGFVDVVASFP